MAVRSHVRDPLGGVRERIDLKLGPHLVAIEAEDLSVDPFQRTVLVLALPNHDEAVREGGRLGEKLALCLGRVDQERISDALQGRGEELAGNATALGVSSDEIPDREHVADGADGKAGQSHARLRSVELDDGALRPPLPVDSTYTQPDAEGVREVGDRVPGSDKAAIRTGAQGDEALLLLSGRFDPEPWSQGTGMFIQETLEHNGWRDIVPQNKQPQAGLPCNRR
jgi:hypothetical protein